MSDSMDQVMSALDTHINGSEDTNMDSNTITLDTDAGKKDPAFIHMPLTPELLAACRLAAGENVALGPWLQERLADQLGVTLPVKVDKRQRYTTEEARQAAKVAAKDKAANLRKGLLAAHRARQSGDKEALAKAEALIAANS